MLTACHRKGVSFIQVKNVPEPLHQAVRRRAAEEGMSISDYILDLIRRDLLLPSRRQWLDRLAARRPIDVDVITALHRARSERTGELTGN
jgi:plasmid stability protein